MQKNTLSREYVTLQVRIEIDSWKKGINLFVFEWVVPTRTLQGKKCKSHLKATLNAHTFIPTQQQQQKKHDKQTTINTYKDLANPS